jgi:hypothetical protein
VAIEMDKFPEAFARFERVVDMRSFRSYRELAYAFSHWAGRRWVNSHAQDVALRKEAEKRGFKDTRIPMIFRRPQVYEERTWRRETVTVRGKPQVRHRDLRNGRFIKKP